MASHPPSPSTSLQSPPAPEGPKESLVARLLITPLAFISFLLSLAFIDSRNHAHRTNSHPLPKTASTCLSARLRVLFHSVVYKPVDSPYAYVRSPEKERLDGMQAGRGETSRHGDEAWYWHTQQKKMMKAEVMDAFRVRNWVALGLIVLLGLFCGGVYGLSRWVSGLVGGWI